MKKLLLCMPFLLTACSATAPKPPAADTPAVAGSSLGDLESTIFSCPKAALNAAAREAKKAPTMGTYQFSYFHLVSDAHHGHYEVRFTSNVHEEPELKYRVTLYCQQGWDPAAAKATVELINDAAKASAAGSDCHPATPPRARHRKKT